MNKMSNIEVAPRKQAMAEPESAKLFMCPPDFFEVAYAINPWMDPDAWEDDKHRLSRVADAQWSALRDTYVKLGHEVFETEAVEGLPDIVFTANSAIVLDGKVLLARFRHPQRQGEESHYRRFFHRLKEKGIVKEVIALPEDVVLEGAGDAVWDPYRRHYWMGHSQRSSRSAAPIIAETYGVRVVPLEMVSERFYHLDVALAPLSRGQLIYIPDAFDSAGKTALVNAAGGEEWLIAATEEDARHFAVNAVNIGDDIITAYMSDTLRSAVEASGYRVHIVPLDTFHMAGGGAFCLTLRLDNRSS